MSKQQKRQKQKNKRNNNSSNNNKTSHNVLVPPLLPSHKRLELNILIKELYQLANKQFTNPKDEWQQYVDIQNMLQEIMLRETVLSPKLGLLEKAKAEGIPIEKLRVKNVPAFNEWLKKNDINYNGLCIAEFPGYGLGIQAKRDIKEGDILFSIPRKMMLNEERLPNEEGGSELGGITISNFKLAYSIIIEKLKGEESFWKPYLDILPVEYNTALYFTVDDMKELRGSNAFSTAAQHCKVIARQYAALYLCLQSTTHVNVNIINKIGQLVKEFFCYDLYRWAVSTATTRQNLIPQCIKNPCDPNHFISTLIPFWDMVNHKEGKITTFYQPEEYAVTSLAQSDFKKGEQIFMHYGNRSNSDLMIHNGFINSENPNDYVNIKMGLSSSDPLFKERSIVLQWLKIPINACELTVLPAPNFISGKLLGFVRVFNMNAAQLEHWNSPDHARDLLHADCALETELESKTWKYLQTRLMLLLRAFPTTIEEDVELLSQHRKGLAELDYKRAMILEYRILEKRILAGALEYVNQRSKA